MGTLMSQVVSLCTEIASRLGQLGLRTPQNLLPGLSKAQIAKLTRGLPFELPKDIFELYQWSEGTNLECGVGNDFFPGFRFEPLTAMVRAYDDLSHADEFPRFHSGDLNWFPVFKSGGMDFYGIVCKGPPHAIGSIVLDDNEGEHRDLIHLPTVEFQNIVAMLRTILASLVHNVFFVADNGQLSVGTTLYNEAGRLVDVDLSKYKEIGRRYNPNLPVWN